MSIDTLKEEIKSNELRNLYLFYGEEEYLKKYYLESIDKIILKDDLTGLNKIVLEGKAEASRIVEACETMPVFSEHKLVIVKNSGAFKSKKDTGKQSIKDELLEYLNNIPPFTCLVFYEEEIDKRLKLVDIIKKKGLIVEFPYQKPNELVKWVVKAFKSNGKEIDASTASFLVDISESGMTEILNEINKVVLFLGERSKVGSDDIRKVCTKSIKSRIFDLTDAIAERNITAALKLLNDMIILKEPLPKILFMIARQLRHILEMKLLYNEGMGMKEACSKIGITPYAGSKVLKQAASFSIDKLKSAIEETLELDLAIKTGRINDRTATEILICKLAQN